MIHTKPGFTTVQNAVRPSSQLMQRPQATLKGMTTLSPRLRSFQWSSLSYYSDVFFLKYPHSNTGTNILCITGQLGRDRFICICEIADDLHEPGPYFRRFIIYRKDLDHEASTVYMYAYFSCPKTIPASAAVRPSYMCRSL